MKRPSNIQKFKPVDPKLGIKSSLPKSKSTIALVILLWLSNDKKYEIEYSETDGDKITISENCYDKLIQYLRNNIDIKGDSEEDIMNYDFFISESTFREKFAKIIKEASG